MMPYTTHYHSEPCIQKGNAVIDAAGEIFGGKIEIADGTEFTWKSNGGKDESGAVISTTGIGKLIVSATGDLSTAREITGNGTVNQNEAGTVTYTGDNSGFKGEFKLVDGKAVIDAKGEIFGGTIVIADEKQLIWNSDGGEDKSQKPITFNKKDGTNRGTGILEIAATGDLSTARAMASEIVGTNTKSGVINQDGKGTVTYKGDNSSFSGGFNLKDGKAIIDADGIIFGSDINIADKTKLTWNYYSDPAIVLSDLIVEDSVTKPINLTGNGSLIIAAEATGTENNDIAVDLETARKIIGDASSNITQDVNITGGSGRTGIGTVTYKGNNSGFKGIFDLQKGNAVIDAAGEIFGGKIEIADGTEFTWKSNGGKDESGAVISTTGIGKLIVSATSDLSTAREITGNGTVNQNEAGTVTYIGDNSGFKGEFKLVDGKAVIDAEGEIFGGAIVIADEKQLIWNSDGDEDKSNAEITFGSGSGGATLEIAATGDLSTARTMASEANTKSGVINQDGKGTVTYKGNNSSFSGGFFLKNGKAVIDDNGSIFAGAINIESGTKLVWNSKGGSEETSIATIKTAGTLEISSSGPLTTARQISGNGKFDQTGAGTVTYTGENDKFTGTFNLKNGEAVIDANGIIFGSHINIAEKTKLTWNYKAGTTDSAGTGKTINLAGDGSLVIAAATTDTVDLSTAREIIGDARSTITQDVNIDKLL